MRRTYARPVTPSEQVWGCFESSAATIWRLVHGTHVCGTGQISPGIIVAVVTTASAYLDRLLRVTVVHLPFVPAQEATNLHHGSSVLLPESSLRPWRSTTFSRAAHPASFGGPVAETVSTAI